MAVQKQWCTILYAGCRGSKRSKESKSTARCSFLLSKAFSESLGAGPFATWALQGFSNHWHGYYFTVQFRPRLARRLVDSHSDTVHSRFFFFFFFFFGRQCNYAITRPRRRSNKLVCYTQLDIPSYSCFLVSSPTFVLIL